AFYASVEQRDRPALRGRRMAVGGGVVLAASYEAREHGVRTAMPVRAARELCPDLVTVPPRMASYSAASKAVFAIFRDTTPQVEPISIDEAFLDVSGLWRLVGPPELIARQLRARVASEVGLPISVGVARTKFLAKVASGVSKPDGMLIVEPGDELDFLHDLPVERLWGVGSKTAEKLRSRGISQVGDVAALEVGSLVALLGPAAGRHIHALAHNRDPRSVQVGKRRRSIGSQRALGRRQRTFEDIDGVLLELVDRVAARLRDGKRVGRTISLRFRFGDYSRDSRSSTLPEATSTTNDLLEAARRLLTPRRQEIQERDLTLLGFTISNLTSADAVQQPLPFGRRSRTDLDEAVDNLRNRFGGEIVGSATLMGKQSGPMVPLLPDPGPSG
ncbi:MAG: DNA polymerase IV, partial [Acidimicrobiales bacterium]